MQKRKFSLTLRAAWANMLLSGGVMPMFENIRADIAMAREQNVSTREWDQRVRVLFQPGTLAVLSYRFCRAMRSIRLPVFRQLAWIPVLVVRGMTQVLTGVHISSKARIGPGFVVHTVYGIFIPPTEIGSNCSVQTGVLLSCGVRRIGNDVLIGSGAKIVGPISIGNNVLIAPNSLVVTDVPDNCTVAGVPARISVGRTLSTLTVLGGKKANSGNHQAAAVVVPVPQSEMGRMSDSRKPVL